MFVAKIPLSCSSFGGKFVMSKKRGFSSLRLTFLFNVGARLIIPNSKSPDSVSIL
jgi:hypothetical protein